MFVYLYIQKHKMKYIARLGHCGCKQCTTRIHNSNQPQSILVPCCKTLTPEDLVTHVCVNEPGHVRHQAITWTNHPVKDFGINSSEIWIKIQQISSKKMNLKRRLQNGGHFVSVSIHKPSLIFVHIYTTQRVWMQRRSEAIPGKSPGHWFPGSMNE